MAAFFQHEAAGIAAIAAPVAHEERAVIGLDMLRCLDGNDVAKAPLFLRLAQVAVERRIAKHQPDQQTLMAILVQKTGKLQAFLDGNDDRLFGEDGEARFQANADMLQVKMVGGADHQKIEAFAGNQFLGVA